MSGVLPPLPQLAPRHPTSPRPTLVPIQCHNLSRTKLEAAGSEPLLDLLDPEALDLDVLRRGAEDDLGRRLERVDVAVGEVLRDVVAEELQGLALVWKVFKTAAGKDREREDREREKPGCWNGGGAQ